MYIFIEQTFIDVYTEIHVDISNTQQISSPSFGGGEVVLRRTKPLKSSWGVWGTL